MRDSMTFRALNPGSQCELCAANPAVLEFDVLTDQERSRHRGFCCVRCASSILQALAQIKPQSSQQSSPYEQNSFTVFGE
jgi:protein-arginine kinase activator protein McsA